MILKSTAKILEIGDESNTNEEEIGILALVLSKSCTLTDIEATGVNALSGVDRDRFQMLQDANKLLTPEKQLMFYLARLGYGAPTFGYHGSSVQCKRCSGIQSAAKR